MMKEQRLTIAIDEQKLSFSWPPHKQILVFLNNELKSLYKFIF